MPSDAIVTCQTDWVKGKCWLCSTATEHYHPHLLLINYAQPIANWMTGWLTGGLAEGRSEQEPSLTDWLTDWLSDWRMHASLVQLPMESHVIRFAVAHCKLIDKWQSRSNYTLRLPMRSLQRFVLALFAILLPVSRVLSSVRCINLH